MQQTCSYMVHIGGYTGVVGDALPTDTHCMALAGQMDAPGTGDGLLCLRQGHLCRLYSDESAETVHARVAHQGHRRSGEADLAQGMWL